MPQHFFQLYDDVYVPNRWHLATATDEQGRELDGEEFRRGTPVATQGRLRIPVEIPGKALDFSETSTGIVVVHVKVAAMLSELAPQDVQLIPADIEGQPEQYLVLVATRRIRCIDEQASRIRLWTEEDGLPHKVGQYASVRDMRIDRSKVGEAQVFRPEGWEVALIVSGEIKTALTRMGATGVKFRGV